MDLPSSRCGPPALGRAVVINAGGPVPPAWEGAERMVIDEAAMADPRPAVEVLHRAWARRGAVIVELGVDPARFRHAPPVDDEVWAVGPGVELWEERLQFLTWTNAYDARLGAEHPVWWWATKAIRLGAGHLDPSDDGPGDVVLPDGRRAWIDGGPRGPLAPELLAGAVVVHRESVERGSLAVAPEPRAPAALLAPDQMAAVSHGSGPARIIAPAGSGKTRVLTERLRHLLADRRWEPDSILAVAYNKKAQGELEARTAGLSARTRTLNGLGRHLITLSRGRAPDLLDERGARAVIERLAPIRRRRANTDPVGPYLEGLSEIRLALVDPEEVEEGRDDVPGLAALFKPYRACLAEAGAVDFDEQIYGAIELLLRDPEFRARVQVDHRHVLVDELQDLTPAHLLLVRLLALPGLDVFGVGDDDQVIYGHAGADPTFLIHYDQFFPEAGDHPLEVNYRCPPDVVRAASTLLGYNHRRVPKVIRAGRSDGGGGVGPVGGGGGGGAGGAALAVTEHPGGEGALHVVAGVRSWLSGGRPPASMAVLARVNSMLLAPHVALAEAGIPITSALGPEVLERTGLRAALAYLRLATAADTGLAAGDIVEILRRPSRGLPPWFSERIRRRPRWSLAAVSSLAQSLSERDAAKIERLVEDLATVRDAAAGGMATSALLVTVREGIGLGGAMSLLDSSKGGEGSSHLDDLEALEQVAGLQPEPAGFEVWLRGRFERQSDPAGVTLSTVHRVKGMEWEAVIVYGATAGILPHRLADDVEEERRILHVAITRGRERVEVLADRRRPSPFLAELDGRAPRRPDAGPVGEAFSGLAEAGSVSGRGSAAGAGSSRAAAGPGRGAGAGGRGSGSGGRGSGPAPLPDLEPDAVGLEHALKAWRRERAKRDTVPVFIVCSDRTLRAIANARPDTLVALRRIDGIGPTKLEAYGEDLLALVAETD